MRKTSGSKWAETTKDRSRLHNEDVHGLSCSANIIRMIKYGRMRWAGHVALMGK